MAGRRDCHARQYGDQMCCGKCALTWDTNDPEPPRCGEDVKASPAPTIDFEVVDKTGRAAYLEYIERMKL